MKTERLFLMVAATVCLVAMTALAEVVVSAAEVANPVAVRYAFKNWAQPNLFNAEGLPTSSFRTDDWPME